MRTADASARRSVPFLAHQATDYVLGAALIAVGVHLSGRPELIVTAGGIAIAGLSVITDGPLGAARFLPKRAHVTIELVLAVLFAVSPLAYVHGFQIIPAILSLAVAVVLVRMSVTTLLVAPERRRGGSEPPTHATRSTMSGDPPLGSGEAGVPSGARARLGTAHRSDVAAATAGRLAGRAAALARRSEVPAEAARGLGRTAARARRLGRTVRATTRSGPAPGPGGAKAR